MSRKGCPNKIQSGICYPRKCKFCEHISNNPSTYHYHKKTHEHIPPGQLCDHGCGQIASMLNTNGKYTCKKIAQHCPEYIKKHSIRVSNQWKDAIERKEKTKKTFLKHCVENPVITKKQKDSLKKKWGDLTPDQAKDYRHYARRIRSKAQRWAKEQGYILGKQTYHVDHKLSIWDAYKAGLSESVVNHPANLQIIDAKQNSSKGSNSSITVNELMHLIRKSVT